MSRMRFVGLWLWNRAKMTLGWLAIAIVGTTPAWVVDRWLFRLDPLVYGAATLVLLGLLFHWTGYMAIVRGWKAEEQVMRRPSTKQA